MNVVPWRSMYPTSFSAISVSKPRRGMERIATVVSYPKREEARRLERDGRRPDAERLPGCLLEREDVVDVMQHLAPGASRYEGRPPTAMMNLSVRSSPPCRSSCRRDRCVHEGAVRVDVRHVLRGAGAVAEVQAADVVLDPLNHLTPVVAPPHLPAEFLGVAEASPRCRPGA